MIGRLAFRILMAQRRWAEPFGNLVNGWLKAIFRPIRPIKDFLNGTWLGHSVHAALTDLPIGVLTLAIVFDVLDLRPAADISVGIGILAMLGAALAGWADYTDTDDNPRTVATVHMTVMLVALVVYLISLWLRLTDPLGDRTVAIVVGLMGYGLLTAGAWIGGEVVYALGNMVNRHAWRFYGQAKWQALDGTDFPEGKPIKTKAGAQNVVVVRMGETLHVLHEQCAHAGGPLAEGRVVDGCIECPWHGSCFDLGTGRRRRGPTTFDQPRYDVRAAEGGWEVRRASDGGQNI